MDRIVTGRRAGGQSADCITLSDRPQPIVAMSGSANQTRLFWSTDPGDVPPHDGIDPVAAGVMAMPGPGQTLFLSVTFPPGAESPLHATPTIDYVVVISGELWLVMADGGERRLASGDVVVQTGTLHAWQNRGDVPCTIAVTMIGGCGVVPPVQ